ncbi:MAG TPA: serine/threonine-protein kinase [Thermoleophilaceae bacterium]|nr:serine/threonine-protein kinase [Thermoleophilaceae bacterium]
MISLPAGTTIGGYRIEELAGRGGMGVVYRATQRSLGRPVALKVISPELADDPRFRERFERESRLTASIDHPNVIPLYEAGAAGDALFMSMRWVPGTTLETLIKRGGGLDPARAAAIVAQVGAALDAAHAHGLLHRDVKPANVLVTEDPTEHVYLTDFGLVKRVGTDAHLTRTGQLLGTIDYVAPEQIRGEEVDARSDIYSLGCVLFHALTGRVPFETDNEVTKIYAHLSEPPPRPSNYVSGLPPGLDDVVSRAMAKDPADRFQTAGRLGRAAAAAADPAGQLRSTVEDGAPPPWKAARSRRREAGRRRTWAWPAALALAAAAGTAVAVALLADDGPESGSDAGGTSRAPPGEGQFLRARDGQTLWLTRAGARFPLAPDERAAFGYEPDQVREVRRAELFEIPVVPPDGTLVKGHGSTVVWTILDGERVLATRPAPANVIEIPRSGLPQIPLPRGGTETTVELDAPTFVVARTRFVLAGEVRSRGGSPRGRCVFYRISREGLRERANNRVVEGRCRARLRVSGSGHVRYSVHFVGFPKWQGSQTATRRIPIHQP